LISRQWRIGIVPGAIFWLQNDRTAKDGNIRRIYHDNMKTNKNKSGIQLGFQTAISYQLIDQKVI
jgi:hypothetical protein